MKKILIFTVGLAVLLCGCGGGNGTASGGDSAAGDSAQKKNLPEKVTIAMTGDIMMGNTWPHDRLPANDGKNIFDDARDILKSADVTCGNLEGVIAPPEVGAPRKNQNSPLAFMFKMPPRYVKYLVDCGYDFLGLANNHIYDFFSAPIDYTEKLLKENGIGFAGAKDPAKKEGNTFWSVKKLNGVTYGFAAFGHERYSPKTQDTAEVHQIINEVRKQCDVLIIIFHGGAEGSAARHLPEGTELFHGDDRGNLRLFTHLCIDWGADVVFGAGPHVPRCMELYKGHFIAYSLGNFCTCGMGVSAQTGLAPLVKIEINPADGLFKNGKIYAFRQQHMAGPKTDKSGEVIKEIRTLTQDDIKDGKLNIADDGTITIKK